jgi:hypothetical protein
MRRCLGIALRRIQGAGVEILIARSYGLALGSLFANWERLIDLYLFDDDAITDTLRVQRLVRQLVALQRNGIIAIRRKVEAGASRCLCYGSPAAALVGRLRGGILREPRQVLRELPRSALRERLGDGRQGQKRKGQENRES